MERLQQKREDKVNITNLIYSEKYGKKSYNLEDPADPWREKCFNALYFDEDFNIDDKAETIRNIVLRYNDFEELFPESLQQKALPFFIEWLIFNVQMIEIIAATNDDAYTIFETMNDRGLKLKPVEMLKGYLLSNIKDNDIRSKANDFWKDRMLELNTIKKEEDSNFIKSWFRAKYAETIRERKRNADKRDFERIGTEFEFRTEDEFLAYRQHFGNLVLLPKDFNQSFGADPYNKKVVEYFGQNIMAKSLNKNCYDKNPSFLKFLKESGLPFEAYDKFKKIDLDTRQVLYQKICEYIWNPELLNNMLSE